MHRFKNILVAGDLAMQFGCGMAKLQDAELHVLHSLEFPELDTVLPSRISAEKSVQYRAEARQHIDTQLANYEFRIPPQVAILTDPPEFAVLKYIEQENIDLVVMGTIARTGISGFLTGNTAEKLLPQIPCSILAAKPPGFVSPVGD